MKVLGFSAKARHGKDTCALLARVIAEEHGIRMASWALAHPLKAIVLGEGGGLFSFTEVFHTKPPAVRRALQLRGTENGRDKFGESLWTLQSEAYLRIFEDYFPIHGVTFPDIRFPNEVEFIRAGGVDVRTYIPRRYADIMLSHGYSAIELQDGTPVDDATWDLSLDAMATATRERDNLIPSPDGMALRIQSNRPTLEGEAAQHQSETALDHLGPEHFDGVIINNTDTSLDDLKEQLTPYVKKLFNLS